MAASSFSSAFLGMGDENEIQIKEQQQQQILSAAQSQPSASNLLKKRRNQPGNPYPDSEIIALSPKTLMATNRFICEVCNKGFQREQNLQLHRRGHNLPWKLKQKGPKDQIKRKVYLCPEPTCVHHDPGRALGDLTGIKKHYSRKHGEKKYKCDKCSKKYAVQSDWKAHSKTCGTREYKCDCGTLFSRRDSFITHRAFCDALAQESARNLNPNSLNAVEFNPPLATQDVLRLGNGGTTRPGPQFDTTLVGPGFRLHPPPSAAAAALFGLQPHNDNDQEDENNQSLSHFGLTLPNKSPSSFQGLMQLPPQLQITANNGSSSSSMAGLFNLGFFPNGCNALDNAGARQGSGGGPEEYAALFSNGNIMSSGIPSLYSTSHAMQNPGAAAHMSATALLQKAAQLGSTTSNNAASSLLKTFGKSNQSTLDQENYGGSSCVYGESYNGISHLQDLVNPLNSSIGGGTYDGDIHDDEYRGFRAYHSNNNNNNNNNTNENDTGFSSGGGGVERAGAGRLTRDFLGVGRGQLQHGMGFSSLVDSQGKNGASPQAFGRGSFH
ncbi:protein indeterminate-domain 4, chloroplastic-like isoform X2 [Henckelia pumila]|uniref:protein indeterminate-domain 4, chloroplastic-like isoform X2 n=1 Tax=Henckelia pumila TaxID=405737 RepID=UPI003C6E3B86